MLSIQILNKNKITKKLNKFILNATAEFRHRNITMYIIKIYVFVTPVKWSVIEGNYLIYSQFSNIIFLW